MNFRIVSTKIIRFRPNTLLFAPKLRVFGINLRGFALNILIVHPNIRRNNIVSL